MNGDPEFIRKPKQAIYSFLKELNQEDWHYFNQPWLHPKKPVERLTTTAALQGRRADQNGSIRTLKASDVGSILDCERLFAGSYAGERVVTKHTTPLYAGKGGTIFHQQIENRLPEWIQTEENGSPMFTHLPSIGYRTTAEYTGKYKDGFWGKMDAYMPYFNAGLELKSVPEEHSMPIRVPNKALVQAAGYTYSLINSEKDTRTPERWFWLYLPLDLSKLNPEDPKTYRVFTKETPELLRIYKNALKRAEKVAKLVDEHGFEGSLRYLHCYKGWECQCNLSDLDFGEFAA